MVRIRKEAWDFTPDHHEVSRLSNFATSGYFVAPKADSFTVLFTVVLPIAFDGELRLLDIPGVLDVRLRQHDSGDRARQNYPAFPLSDGTVPVLEATVTMRSEEHPDWRQQTIGIPLAMLQNPKSAHQIVLHFAGADWQMFVDSELLDAEFPFGYPHWTGVCEWQINAKYVRDAALYLPGISPQCREVREVDDARGIQYWLPAGHNDWVGDVATAWFNERFHIFYLYDRRHHASKFGGGGHVFAHLSSSDFHTWQEHELAVPLAGQWMSVGTGLPFVFDGKLYLSYGLHTARFIPREQTALPAQWDYLEENGRTGSFRFAEIAGYPAGSTYSICTDGLAHFEASQLLFHPCENPSVYIDPNDGTLRMLANYQSRGIWTAESLTGGWYCLNPDFPPGGDCTFFFHWGDFDYIIGGFTDLWRKPAGAPDSAYEDLVAQGLDFYDGSNVPAITEIPGGRRLMAAWLPIRGWGGPLLIRELLQMPDGQIGSKWMPEITPPTSKPLCLAERIDNEAVLHLPEEACLLSFEVLSTAEGQGTLGITFSNGEDQQLACEFSLRPSERRAQFAPANPAGFAERQLSLREGGSPQLAENYAIEHLLNTDATFTVRIMVINDPKIGGALLDAEIAGMRTIITHRANLTVKQCHFRTEGVDIRNVRVAHLL